MPIQDFRETGNTVSPIITDYENDRHRYEITALSRRSILDRGRRVLKRVPVASHISPPTLFVIKHGVSRFVRARGARGVRIAAGWHFLALVHAQAGVTSLRAPSE